MEPFETTKCLSPYQSSIRASRLCGTAWHQRRRRPSFHWCFTHSSEPIVHASGRDRAPHFTGAGQAHAGPGIMLRGDATRAVGRLPRVVRVLGSSIVRCETGAGRGPRADAGSGGRAPDLAEALAARRPHGQWHVVRVRVMGVLADGRRRRRTHVAGARHATLLQRRPHELCHAPLGRARRRRGRCDARHMHPRSTRISDVVLVPCDSECRGRRRAELWIEPPHARAQGRTPLGLAHAARRYRRWGGGARRRLKVMIHAGELKRGGRGDCAAMCAREWG